MLSAAMAATMMEKAVKKASKQTNAWSTALRILTRRDHSVAELRGRLTEKGFNSEEVEEAIQRCLDHDYLNDERFATNRATSLMKQGRAVGHRIVLDLHQRGIQETLAEQALASARETHNETALLAELLDRRFPDFKFNLASAKEKRRVISFLQRRGFTIGLIMEHLTQKGSCSDHENR